MERDYGIHEGASELVGRSSNKGTRLLERRLSPELADASTESYNHGRSRPIIGGSGGLTSMAVFVPMESQ